ncbi:unnamed protein product [Linum trigynum]|uniref:Uncharacterized protein n=1 Tax=Linum trigynum TaxID=586398 RepID=A0AAV2CR58_9ROSI
MHHYQQATSEPCASMVQRLHLNCFARPTSSRGPTKSWPAPRTPPARVTRRDPLARAAQPSSGPRRALHQPVSPSATHQPARPNQVAARAASIRSEHFSKNLVGAMTRTHATPPTSKHHYQQATSEPCASMVQRLHLNYFAAPPYSPCLRPTSPPVHLARHAAQLAPRIQDAPHQKYYCRREDLNQRHYSISQELLPVGYIQAFCFNGATSAF